MFIQGSNFNILGSTNLNSSGNVNILSAKNTTTNIHETIVTESNPWALFGSIIGSVMTGGVAGVGIGLGVGSAANYLSQKTTTDINISSVQTNVATNINSDTLNINAGMDLNNNVIVNDTANINVIGSNLTTLNALGLTSTGQTNILSSQNQNTYFTEHILQQHDIGAMFTAIGAGIGSGAGAGAAGGAAGGALFGIVGAGPGGCRRAIAGGFGG